MRTERQMLDSALYANEGVDRHLLASDTAEFPAQPQPLEFSSPFTSPATAAAHPEEVPLSPSVHNGSPADTLPTSPSPQSKGEVTLFQQSRERFAAAQLVTPSAAADFPSPVPESDAAAQVLVPDFDHARQRFDAQLAAYRHLQRRLKSSGVSEEQAETYIDPQAAQETTTPATYPTPFGTLIFSELHDRTRQYAASVLRHTYLVSEADIDDGLQAGYAQLWQRLQGQPDLLQDKSLAWIGKGVVYRALHETRSDWQFRRRTADEPGRTLDRDLHLAKVERKAHSRETRQADVRTDLHKAIQSVAERILTHKSGKRGDHDLWALYGLTMLQTSASEVSRLFGVREQTMQSAYQRVKGWLREALPHYQPAGMTRPARLHGRTTLPKQDLMTIRRDNGAVSDAVYEAVGRSIQTNKADTWRQDLLALAGIREEIPAQRQARTCAIPVWRMQRAYDRVHLMIGAQRDPTVRTRHPERRRRFVFSLTDDSAGAVERLALKLLQEPKSYEKLVALHAHIANLAISTTAKRFNIPTSTLRYYAQQIGAELGTPTKPAREA